MVLLRTPKIAPARRAGVEPGGDIVIHGGTPAGYQRQWAYGCIAVGDVKIEEIRRLVPLGTPVLISP